MNISEVQVDQVFWSFMEAVFLPGNFRIFSGEFQLFSDEKKRKRPKVMGKNWKISEWAYCFHLPAIFRFFLEDMVNFSRDFRLVPAVSCLHKSSTWAGYDLSVSIKDNDVESNKSDRSGQADRPKSASVADFHRSENHDFCLRQANREQVQIVALVLYLYQ